MILAKVVGTVVCTKRADGIPDAKYMLVDRCDQRGRRKGDFHVVLDHMNAGPGEMVFVSQGSPNRQTKRTFDRPIDASIIGIVDLIDPFGQAAYKK